MQENVSDKRNAPRKALPANLQQTLSLLRDRFGDSSDFYAKPIQLHGISCAIVFFTGLSSPEKLWVMALDAITREPEPMPSGPALMAFLLTRMAVPAESAAVSEQDALVAKLCGGTSVLLIDGCAGGIAFATQDQPQRSVSIPEGEGTLRGSQEGFTELLRSNISLLRRQFRGGDLCVEIAVAKCRADTEYCLCYDKRLAPPGLVARVRKILADIELPVLLDTAYLASFFKQDKLNLFPAAGYTERPATACARLCEGKIIILVAGCPSAMVLPSFFAEHFETLDDYASGAVFAGLMRLLKYLAFLFSVFGPGFYLLAVHFSPEMLPIQRLCRIARGEADTPLPLGVEMLAVTFLLEIVREAGLRAPHAIGGVVSLVGGLIVGETAVSAGLTSVPVLTVSAAATVATLAVPSLYEQSILFRFLCILAVGAGGLPGFVCCAVSLLAMACGTSQFGYDYLYPLAPLSSASWRDGFVRSIWSRLAGKGYTVGDDEKSKN